MRGHCELRFAGSGGQGVILCSIILAEAGFLAGKQVAQSQAYGPEARGGLCKAELVVDDARITYPKVERADFLMALTSESAQKYCPETAEGTLILVDENIGEVPGAAERRVVRMPILDTAVHKVGKAMTANIVAVGAINALLEIAPADVLEEAVRMHIPRGTEELNLCALREGIALARERTIA